VAFYQVLYWKDIPAEVRVLGEGRRSKSRPMPQRFQNEIDARAMREGLVGSDEYMRYWRWSQRCQSDLPPEELLDTIVRELEAEHATKS
jgi:Virulence factor